MDAPRWVLALTLAAVACAPRGDPPDQQLIVEHLHAADFVERAPVLLLQQALVLLCLRRGFVDLVPLVGLGRRVARDPSLISGDRRLNQLHDVDRRGAARVAAGRRRHSHDHRNQDHKDAEDAKRSSSQSFPLE